MLIVIRILSPSFLFFFFLSFFFVIIMRFLPLMKVIEGLVI